VIGEPSLPCRQKDFTKFIHRKGAENAKN